MQSDQRILELEGALRRCRQECEAAHKAEGRFRTFSDRVKDYAFIAFDAESRIVSWSRGAEQILGYAESEIVGQPGSLIFTPEDRLCGEAENELATARREGSAEDERWHLRRDGTRFWGSGVLTAHRDTDGNIEGYSKVMRDLTSRVLAEQELRNAEERFRLFADNVTDYALVPVDTAGNVSGWNSGAERTFGYTEKEIIGRPVALFFTPEDREQRESEKDLDRALTEGRAEDSRWMVRRDGSRFWSRWVTTPMRDGSGDLRGFAKVLRDETERKQAEDLLNRSVQETELLLREIHHRVKNNLNVIAGLLSLQARQSQDDPKVQRILDELQDRVRAIAALHETLYSSRDLADINFGPYLQQLLNELVGFNGIDEKRIQIRMEADDVVLSMEQALPVGLIANELVSNTLKHAFPDDRSGAVVVHFRYSSEAVASEKISDTNWCELSVQDNGVGIADVSGIWERGSMGLRIIHLLTKQLHGAVTLDQMEGTRFSVRFPLQDSLGEVAPASMAGSAATGCSQEQKSF
jgi:PAS domain S-box-containing protein